MPMARPLPIDRKIQLPVGWNPWNGTRLLWRLLILAAAVVLYWATAMDIKIRPQDLIDGLPHMANLIGRMFPPDWAVLADLVGPTIETLEIAIWGTTLAVFVAVPLSLLAARNIAPHPVLYTGARLILNVLRGVPEILFALIFVASVGLGPFPGVLALAVHSAGQLGKFLAEAIENIDPGPREAVEATGSGLGHVVRYAIIPQILPEAVTYMLYRWEVNVRAAFVLGLVGAGGLGFELQSRMRLFRYPEVLTIILLIFAVVVVMEMLGNWIRAKLI